MGIAAAVAAKLAQPGWSINVVIGRKAGKWHVFEVGNVYPDPLAVTVHL